MTLIYNQLTMKEFFKNKHNLLALSGFILMVWFSTFIEIVMCYKEWEFWGWAIVMSIILWLMLFRPIEWSKF